MTHIKIKRLCLLAIISGILTSPIMAQLSYPSCEMMGTGNSHCEKKQTMKKMKMNTMPPKSYFDISGSFHQFSINQLKSFHLDQATGYGLSFSRQMMDTPFYVEVQTKQAYSYSGGHKTISGFNPVTNQTLSADIEKEKHYHSSQYRIGVSYYALPLQKLSLALTAGLSHFKNDFDFTLNSISSSHNPNHFNLPTDSTETAIGPFMTVQGLYHLNSQLYSSIHVDYSRGLSIQQNQLGNLGIGFNIGIKI